MNKKDHILYDGHCGLCHRWVRFVIPRDPQGTRFAFSPLQGQTFQKNVPQETRDALPDSIIVHRTDGSLLVKSNAVFYILKQLPGTWPALAALATIIPRPIRDFAYDRVAAIRHKLFKKPADTCPIIPPHIRERFLP